MALFPRIASILCCLVTMPAAIASADACAQEKKPIDPHEKRFTLTFKNTPWKDVFVWVAEQAGMPYASAYKAPPGTFTHSSPKGKKLSLIDVIDIVNESLVEQKHVLLRREVTLSMHPLDADVPEYKWNLVDFEDLHKQPKHVPVRTLITTVNENAEDAAESIKHLIGPGGHLTALDSQIIVRANPQAQRFVFQALRMREKKSFRFTFGGAKPATGVTPISPTDVYTEQQLHGFDLDSKVRATESGVTSDKPFFFSILLPEGNYDVTIRFGDAKDATDTTVLAESRRLMLPSVKTAAGTFETRTIPVNIRNSNLAGGGRVNLKDREINGPVSSPVLHWDDKLTLEFSGKRPSVNAIEIARNDSAITVFLAGDSTVTDQTQGDFRGWGQMLPSFFKPKMVAIANHAESGEATTSFIAAKRLDKILQLIKEGDYLFIQFGHNDQNQKRSIGDYTKALKHYLDEARKRDAIPVLVTPIARRNFGPDGMIRNNLGDYPEAVRKLAKDEKVALIDLNALSKEYYESLGPEKSKIAFVAKDNTHTNEVGALELGRRVADAIRKSDLGLANFLIN